MMIQKNYYEILNLPWAAGIDEVEKAYQRALSDYRNDAPELYSLYSEDEKEAQVQSLSEAYSVLKDPAKKLAYDEALGEVKRRKQTREEGMPLLTEKRTKSPMLSAVKRCYELKMPAEVQNDIAPHIAEGYRILFTKMEEIRQKKSYKVFAVTSPTKGDGKTSTSLNLAYLISNEFGKKVALVECDLKNPGITGRLGQKPSEAGLVDLLAGESSLSKIMAPFEDNENLHLLPALKSVKNSTVLLSSPRMTEVIDALRREYDYVIVDCPPVMPLSDMNVISKKVDGLLMVVRAEKTPKDVVKKAISSLSGVDVVGIIFNGCKASGKKYSYYY